MRLYVCSICREALPATAYARWGTIGGVMQSIVRARGSCDDCRDWITQYPAFKPVPTMIVERSARPVRGAVQEDDSYEGDERQELHAGNGHSPNGVVTAPANGAERTVPELPASPVIPRAAMAPPPSGKLSSRLARLLLGAIEDRARRNGSEPPAGPPSRIGSI